MRYAASVIVPSYGRPEQLRRCLEALLLLNGGPYEIIVVDDGSPESLSPVCGTYDGVVRYIRQDNAGPAAARNTGASAARSDLLAFTDDDCRPEPQWLQALMVCHAGVERRLVGGRVINLLRENLYAAASQSLCDFLYDWFRASEGEAPFFTSNNIACSRSQFERIGGFDQSFPSAAAEDREFGLRWRSAGGELAYTSEAIVGHAHALTFRSFLRQHANYGRGTRHLHRVLDGGSSSGGKLQAVSFYLALVSYPLFHAERGAIVQSALLAISQAAMIRGYVSADSR